MPLDSERIRPLLKAADFKTLFVEELGWDRHDGSLPIPLDGTTYALKAVAHKRGLVVYQCPPGADGRIPLYATRRKIERLVAKSVYEHLLIFGDGGMEHHVWQWVKREIGKPSACREHHYHRGQPGDSLIQKLSSLAVSLAEEEVLTGPDVPARVRAAFDVDRVTKRFYEVFQKEKVRFEKFIEGIPEAGDRAWYTSVMLNRLMFVYFIQKKGFLDGDEHYLRHRLEQVRTIRGRDKFQTFYRYFLLRLFHEGLGQPERSRELESVVGKVPYLNGGIFLPHPIEVANPKINIPDDAFARIFDFFDSYQWHLDERPLRRDDEINPDVLGYIFEKYINQKQMGAYYTKEDITEYISKNSVIPFLFDAARAKCPAAFEGPQSVWRLLAADPDRYIYPAVAHGIVWNARQTPPARLARPAALPAAIAAGIKDVAKRDGWNRPADPQCALPTEIWREVVARRQRYEEVRARLAAGEVAGINDLITYTSCRETEELELS